MRINIKLSDSFASADESADVISVEIPAGSTVLNALETACRHNEKFKLAAKNNSVLAQINGKWTDGSNVVSEGEEIEFFHHLW